MREEARKSVGALARYVWREVLMLPLALLGVVVLLIGVFGVEWSV